MKPELKNLVLWETLHWLNMTANSVDKVAESLTEFIRSIATDACPMDEIPTDKPSNFPHVDVGSEAPGGKRTNIDNTSALSGTCYIHGLINQSTCAKVR